MANALKCDFILHSGDLFDMQRPSQQTLRRTMAMMREHLIGKDPVRFEVSNEEESQQSLRRPLNFHSEDINIKLPMFIIHGNHDPPVGMEGTDVVSVLDILSEASLVNDIGQHVDFDNIELRPLLLHKGANKIALYGLGHIRDERMNRIFSSKKIKFQAPPEPADYFSILLFHQNRYKGNAGGAPAKNCIHEEMLPSFIDLVIWGHEHDCQIDVQACLNGPSFIMQPGSTVVTSLSLGESIPKRNGVLLVKGKKLRLESFPLLTPRLFVFDEAIASELIGADKENSAVTALWQGLENKIKSMIASAATLKQERDAEWQVCLQRIVELLHTGAGRCEDPTWNQAYLFHPRHESAGDFVERLKMSIEGLAAPAGEVLPLIRLRVQMDPEQNAEFPVSRFSSLYVNQVANPTEVILIHKPPLKRRARKSGTGLNEVPAVEISTTNIEDLIFYHVNEQSALTLLIEPDLNAAVKKFADKTDTNAIESVIYSHMRDVQKLLKQAKLDDEEAMRKLVVERSTKLRETYFAENGGSALSRRPSIDVIHPPPHHSDDTQVDLSPRTPSESEMPSTLTKVDSPSPRRRKATVLAVSSEDEVKTPPVKPKRQARAKPVAKAKAKSKAAKVTESPSIADLVGSRKKSQSTSQTSMRQFQ
eukprot:Blabericola_migrator_1__5060@NODE_2620_length_2528_cov_21_982527_g1642_i0_p1_GENE_NODE_2620_length_2528_cov_21_982527_g1642_i0NODE_2620_length_2528_cov_21_982527_g1642_i0_p1_ORF_typecomplete_len648_score123_66Mre11_DNA_bind/PF04152_14/4e23Mre11_DNA_bind/PF04152_14/3_3e03Metallophos/PF00149_28/3_6e12Metallophos_2/PF12850_7/0_00011Metallophos_2/PF12850_7/8_2e03_NODE_2620_length_2528_cov_21_982527_g1642_i01672110